MYFIKKPKTIQIVDLVSGKPMGYKNPETDEIEMVNSTFYQFMVGSILKSAVFGKNAMTVMHAIDIKEKVEATEDESYFSISDEAYNLLKESFKTDLPVVYDPTVAIQFKPFFGAVLDATQTAPVVSKPKPLKKSKK